MAFDESEDEIVLDKDVIFLSKLHETLINNFDLIPVSIRFRKDPDIGFAGGDFLLQYDLGYGEELLISCRREGGNILIELESGEKQVNYSVPLDLFVDDEFMPVVDEEYEKLVVKWFE